MILLEHSHHFLKKYQKLPLSLQLKVDERIRLFLEDRRHPLLKVHRLSGKLQHTSSLNVTGDIRVWFAERLQNEQLVITFTNVGTHSELYG